MRQFTTGDRNKQVGDLTAAPAREPGLLTKHRKPCFVLMSYEHYERMRTGGDPRRAYHVSESPEEHRDLFLAEIDQLVRGESYDDEP